MSDKVILLVEDDPDDKLLIERAFKKSNIPNRIIWVKDGVEALDFLLGKKIYESLINRHLIILLDLKLPKINGLEVLKAIRKDDNTKHIPVIIFTSSNEEQDKIKCYENGANSYINKPIDSNLLNDIVNKIGYYWLCLNQSL